MLGRLGDRCKHPQWGWDLGQPRRAVAEIEFNAFFEKRERERIQDCPILGTPIIPGTGKTTDFKFCAHVHRVDRNKSS